jgi:type VI secretion system secreted protein Hcp
MRVHRVFAAAAAVLTLAGGSALVVLGGSEPAEAGDVAAVLAMASAPSSGLVAGSEGGALHAQSAGAVDYFLKVDGIEGESTDDTHKGQLDLLSYSWGIEQSGRAAGVGGGGAGKVTFQDFSFTSNVSKATPKLFLACASGEHIKEVVLSVRKKGEAQQDYLVIKMTDVIITSYQTGGSNGAIPVDQVSLNFGKIEVEYRGQRPDGSLEPPIRAAWDLKANKRA